MTEHHKSEARVEAFVKRVLKAIARELRNADREARKAAQAEATRPNPWLGGPGPVTGIGAETGERAARPPQ